MHPPRPWRCTTWHALQTVQDDFAVTDNGYWFKRVSGATIGMVKTTGSISTFVANAGAGGAVARAMLVWRVAMSSCSVRSQQARPSAGVQSSTRRESRRVWRQVDWRVLSAHRWARQRASHNRRTRQVMDHGLLSERK